MTSAQARGVSEVLDDRIGTRATCIASQLSFDLWYELMPDLTVADIVMKLVVCSCSHPCNVLTSHKRRIPEEDQRLGDRMF